MADAPDMAGAPKTVVVLRRLAHAAAVGLMTGAVICTVLFCTCSNGVKFTSTRTHGALFYAVTLARTTCSYASRFTSQGGATPSEQAISHSTSAVNKQQQCRYIFRLMVVSVIAIAGCR